MPKLEMTWSETTLIYWMMVERYPNLKQEIPGREVSSVIDRILVMCSIASCALALACWPFVSKRKELEMTIYVNRSLATTTSFPIDLIQRPPIVCGVWTSPSLLVQARPVRAGQSTGTRSRKLPGRPDPFPSATIDRSIDGGLLTHRNRDEIIGNWISPLLLLLPFARLSGLLALRH